MEIIFSNIQSYISQHSKHLSEELEELERQTYLRVLLPNMISGKEQGTFLYLFFSALRPKKVLEIGTFTGYSAICMAMGMEDDATLITMDINDEISYLARDFFKKTNQEHKIDYRIGDAMKMIEEIEDHSLDCIFIDADKRNYPNYYHKSKSKLKQGGFLMIDNVLWHGKIVEPNPNKDTEAILELNELIANDPDFVSNIVPIRDGITIARKK